MTTRLAVATVLLLTASLANAEELAALSLDDPTAVSPRIEADTKIKTEGKSSIKITTRWPATICLGEVAAPDVDGAQLVYSAKVKTNLEKDGTAFLELWADVNGGQYFSKGTNGAVVRKSGWKTTKALFQFQEGQKPDKLTLNLVIGGKGTVWIDEVVLSKEPLK